MTWGIIGAIHSDNGLRSKYYYYGKIAGDLVSSYGGDFMIGQGEASITGGLTEAAITGGSVVLAEAAPVGIGVAVGGALEASYGTQVIGATAKNMARDSQFLAKAISRDQGNRPPNLSPEGAGRNGAFREAKRNSGIPVSQQPKKVTPAVDKRGKRIPGRDYDFGDGNVIRDHSGGHDFPDDPSQNRGPHFNDVNGDHYDYEK